MNIKKIIREEVDDFDWIRGPIEFTIDLIMNKDISYRENNLDEFEVEGYHISELNKNEIKFGPIRDRVFKVVSQSKSNETVEIKLDRGDGSVTYDVTDVLYFVNLGIWVVYGEDGAILN